MPLTIWLINVSHWITESPNRNFPWSLWAWDINHERGITNTSRNTRKKDKMYCRQASCTIKSLCIENNGNNQNIALAGSGVSCHTRTSAWYGAETETWLNQVFAQPAVEKCDTSFSLSGCTISCQQLLSTGLFYTKPGGGNSMYGLWLGTPDLRSIFWESGGTHYNEGQCTYPKQAEHGSINKRTTDPESV